MKQQHAFNAQVKISKDGTLDVKETVPTNRVTIEIIPVFQSGEFLGYVTEEISGLPTEDPDTYHDLNERYDSDDESTDWYLTKDSQVDIDNGQVLIMGSSQYNAMGDKITTWIPVEAVEFEWGPQSEQRFIRHKHIWEDVFDTIPTDSAPDESVFDWTTEWSNIGDVLVEFVQLRDDAELHGDDSQLVLDNGCWIAQEAGHFAIGKGEVTTLKRDADPEKFKIIEGDYPSPVGWDNFYGLPGAHEQHGDDGPWLVYEDEDTNVCLG